jgi:hypothetical protein
MQRVIVPLLIVAIVAGSLLSTNVWAKNEKNLSTVTLSEPEIEMLSFMREEEKLARDVYLKMFEMWGAVIFLNILDSEQRHMHAIKRLLDKYALADPAQADAGLFTDDNLQKNYHALVDAGTISFVEGLYAGATIEEIDMIDIQHAIDITSQIDIITTYQNLLEGSKNHLRAYVRALEAQGIQYDPQYLSPELFKAILAL